jgi:alpha-beta hydrolase superfamily lysophospholipase
MTYVKPTLFILLGILLTIFFARAFESREQVPLEAEHRIVLEKDFLAKRDHALDWIGYLALEQEVLQELEARIEERSREAEALNRHAAAGPNNPNKFAHNWNLSYKVEPVGELKGSAVLIHGLTDSPYSMRATAGIFSEAGLETFVPRVPGHGFNAGSLASREKEDWQSVVELSVRAADAVREPGQPLVIGGYSNGAILALSYAIECKIKALPCPDRILLMSPAIAVSNFAWFGRLHRIVSWIPYFSQFQWESIYPEVDSFKFTSFPKSSGFETASLADDIHEALESSDLDLPPILAFQSVVDATVSTDAVLAFFKQIGGIDHELVFYDMNRFQYFSEWIKAELEDLNTFEQSAPLPMAVTILSNQSNLEQFIAEYRLKTGELKYEITPTDLAWPTAVYSLSHIAIPFSPDDEQYGETGRAIGTYSPKGERGIISLGPSYFLRMRYNPFFEYQKERIEDWLAEGFADN